MSAEGNDGLRERVAHLETLAAKQEETSKTIWRIFEAVYGNGKPGLIAQMQAIQTKLDAATAHKSDWKWLVSTIIAIAAVLVALKGTI